MGELFMFSEYDPNALHEILNKLNFYVRINFSHVYIIGMVYIRYMTNCVY